MLELPKEIQDEIIRRRINSSMAEELTYVKNKTEQSELAKLVVQRHLTIKKFRDSFSSISDTKDDNFLISTSHDNRNTSIFDKVIISLKLSERRIIELIDTVENNFLIHEFLLQEKNMITAQIDHIIKSRKKYSRLGIRINQFYKNTS